MLLYIQPEALIARNITEYHNITSNGRIYHTTHLIMLGKLTYEVNWLYI